MEASRQVVLLTLSGIGMVSKKRLVKYLDKRWEGLLENLSILSISMDREALHHLRLHTKKLRAIALFAGLHKQHFIEELKPLIRLAGEIRAAEISRQLLKEHGYELGVLQQELDELIEKGYRQLQQDAGSYKHLIPALKEKWNKEVNEISERRVEIFLTLIITALRDAFAHFVFESDLHDNRKKIKELLYVFLFLPKKLQNRFRIDEEYLDNLQEKIGAWHDLEMTRLVLAKRQMNYEAVYAALKKDQSSLYEEIRMETKVFKKKVVGVKRK